MASKNKTSLVWIIVVTILLLLTLVMCFSMYRYPVVRIPVSQNQYADALLTYVPGIKMTNVHSIASGDITILDPETLYVRLYVANIESLIMAHIHILDASNNDPPILTLISIPNRPISIGSKPVLIVKNRFSIRDFINDLQGKNMAYFLQQLSQKKLFFNVHTELNPNGELQGTINMS